MRWLFIILTLSIACTSSFAQRTTRHGLKAKSRVNVEVASETPYDTIVPLATTDIVCSGYEKTLRSRKETILITNNTSYTIEALNITIEYLDTQDRQLHQRTLELSVEVPPQQTRMTYFPAWDKQQVWYYEKSEPTRTRLQATPYRVAITINYVLVTSS